MLSLLKVVEKAEAKPVVSSAGQGPGIMEESMEMVIIKVVVDFAGFSFGNMKELEKFKSGERKVGIKKSLLNFFDESGVFLGNQVINGEFSEVMGKAIIETAN